MSTQELIRLLVASEAGLIDLDKHQVWMIITVLGLHLRNCDRVM